MFPRDHVIRTERTMPQTGTLVRGFFFTKYHGLYGIEVQSVFKAVEVPGPRFLSFLGNRFFLSVFLFHILYRLPKFSVHLLPADML